MTSNPGEFPRQGQGSMTPMEIKTDYDFVDKVTDYPVAVGSMLADDDLIGEMVFGAYDTDLPPEAVTEKVVSGLIMGGAVEWKCTRIPALRKKLGQFVIGNRHIYIKPKKPN